VSDPLLDLDFVFSSFDFDYIINAVGLIKQLIIESDPISISMAEQVNSIFPKKLNEFSKASGIPVIQIGTDCVYSGFRGSYTESDPFDPTDIYGDSKVIGEKHSQESMTIRCSIIGRELRSKNSLLEWVLSQPRDSQINGYINHIWNGVTTLDFAKIVLGIVSSDSFEKGVMHLIPRNHVSKFELIKRIAEEYERKDIRILEFNAEISINRTLGTINPDRNSKLWALAGYNEVPTIEHLLGEYSKWS
jgi:dTDP-4-dehydrorhamnose reductase